LGLYPNFELFAKKKKKLDPKYKFRNSLFDKYIYAQNKVEVSNFYEIVKKDEYKDKFYDFLLNVFRTNEKRVFYTLLDAIDKFDNTDAIYLHIQKECKISAKTLLSPASVVKIIKQIFKQNKTIKEQTQALLTRDIDSFLLIEPTDKTKATKLYSAIDKINLSDVLGIFPKKADTSFFIQNNETIIDTLEKVGSESVELVSIYGGLHHLTKENRLKAHAQIQRILKPKGLFILREHDVTDDDMFKFVSLIHAVFNAVTGESLEEENQELREFESLETIVNDVTKAGFKETGERLKQYGDPSENTLLCFEKIMYEK